MKCVICTTILMAICQAVYGDMTAKCLPSWVFPRGTDQCYQLPEQNRVRDFQQSRDLCEGQGGDSLMIPDKTTKDFLVSVLLKNDIGDVYTNAQTDDKGKTWKWLEDGSDVDTSFIQIGKVEGSCGVFTSSGKLNGVVCTEPHAFMCHRPIEIPPPCNYQRGYQQMNDHCYLVSRETRLWNTSQIACQADGGSLITITDGEEQYFAKDLARNLDGYIWIGLTEMGHPGSFQWVNDGESNFTAWEKGEPTNKYKGTGSAAIDLDNDYGDWTVLDGAQELNHYMCKKPQEACVYGWEAFGDSCYYFNGKSRIDQMVWEHANATCEQVGAHLVIIDGDLENDFIADHMSEDEDFWIGLKTVPHDHFYWIDGQVMNYTKISASTQRSALYHDYPECVYVLSLGDSELLWAPTKCNAALRYVCEVKQGEPLTLINNQTDKYCPSTWKINNGTCYYFSYTTAAWETGRGHCMHYNGDLVKIESWEEQDFVFSHVYSTTFIGYRYDSSTHTWSWVDGSNGTFNNWEQGYPYTYADDECAAMSYSSGQWISHSCYGAYYYACETAASDVPYNPGVSTTTTEGPGGDCGGGWTENPKTGECYKLVLEMTDYYLANSYCESLTNASLVSLSTPAEQQFVQDWLQKMKLSQEEIYIGLKNDISGGLSWVDKSPVGYLNFDAGKPVAENTCIVMYISSGKWSDGGCVAREAYVCEKKGPKYTPPTPPTPPSPTCPGNWVAFNKECYYFSEANGTRRMTWEHANAWCQSHLNSQLASVENEAENNYFNGSKVNLWLGLQDDGKGKNWHWTDGNDYGLYTNWYSNQPSSKYHCGMLSPSLNGKWITSRCNETQAFVCKLNLDLCPDGWMYNNSKCYFRSKSVATYEESKETCKKLNTKANILSINDHSENRYVAAMMMPNIYSQNNYVWIGYTYDASSDYWTWDDGSTSNYTNWGPGLPSQSETKNCTALKDSYYTSSAGLWENMYCSAALNYSCEFFPKHHLGCEEGWKYFQGYCYLFGKESVSFKEAISTCKQYKSYPVSLHDKEDSTFVYAYVSTNYQAQGTWIGITDDGHPGEMEFLDSSPVTYTAWYYILAKSRSEPQCAAITESDHYWHMVPCDSTKYTYTCKRGPEVVDLHPIKSGCNSGDDLFWEGKCYHLPEKKYTWEDAKSACAVSNSNLLRIEDSSEGAFFAANLGEQDTYMWTDVQARTYGDGSSDFVFDNGHIVYYLPWDDSQPDLHKGKCVLMSAKEETSGLYDMANCTQKYKFICEYDRSGYTPPPVETTTAHGHLCLSGWVHFNGHCYQVYNSTTVTWSEGEILCQSYGGHLVSINSKEEETLLKNITKNRIFHRGIYSLWVGLELKTEADKSWTDGSSIDFVHWAPDQPAMHDHENCASAGIRTMLLSCTVCETHLPYACEAIEGSMTTTLAPPTFPPPTPCDDVQGDDDWMLYKGHCYKVIPGDMSSWDEAVNLCYLDGGSLVSIANVDENYFLESLMHQIPNDILWVGGHATEDEGFQWVDGTAFKYTNWAPGEPSNIDGEEDCIGMYTLNQGRWLDSNCAHQYGRVCERPYGKTAAPPPSTPAPSGNCPEGWIREAVQGRCFYYNYNKTQFEDAEIECRDLHPDAHLASFHSKNEFAYFVAAMGEIKEDTFVGLKYEKRQYVWTDQSSVDFLPWAPGQPNGRTSGEDCGKIVYPTALMHDISCTDTYGFICSMKQDPSITHPSDLPRCDAPYKDYYSYGDDCFDVRNETKSWKDAEAACTANDGHLVSTLSLHDNAFLWVISQDGNIHNPWIGFNDLQTKNTYLWSDGWPVFYTGWGDGQPQLNASDKDCVKLSTKDGLWYNDHCDEKKPFICKHSGDQPPTIDPNTPMHCPDPTFSNAPGSFCYLVVNDLKTWNAANTYCSIMNANLSSVHSKYESNLLVNAAKGLPWNIWIGLIGEEDKYRWSDKTPYDYFNWAAGEPDGNNQPCVELNKVDGTWDTIPCSAKRPFVCKANKVKGGPPTPPPPSSHTTKEPKKGLSGGAIFGIVFGSLVVVAAIGLGIYFGLKKRLAYT